MLIFTLRLVCTNQPSCWVIFQEHGPFRREVPCMPMALAVLCCLLNFFIFGFGTIVAGLSLLCCSKVRSGSSRRKAICMNLFAGFLQFVTFPLVVGVVWSIMWGVLFIQTAHDKKTPKDFRRRQPKEKNSLINPDCQPLS
ncbi:hypothetical protein AB6A40_005351 [Gnathostoma spinigerum]|uniref:Uncharacterized protein n=1 Tax=Gnathostoma spinigerum TaxID=75299 RepID=A0ABD6EHE1_9BILA